MKTVILRPKSAFLANLWLAHGFHQGRKAGPVPAIRIRAERQEQLQKFQIGDQIYLRTEEIPLIWIGAILEQHSGDLEVFVSNRQT